jgi:hypothetical protein
MTVAFSHSPMAMTSDKMQRTYLVVRCIVEFLLLNRCQAARMRRLALVFTGSRLRTDDERNVFGKLFTNAVVEKGIRQALGKQLLTGHFQPNASLDRL